MGTFINSKVALKAALDTLKGAGERFEEVFDYMEPTPRSYPCAMIDMLDRSTNERFDSASNMLSCQYVIRIFIRATNDKTASDLRLNVLDDVIELFNSPAYVDTLGGACEKFDMLSILPFFTEQFENPCIGFDIIVSVGKLVSVI